MVYVNLSILVATGVLVVEIMFLACHVVKQDHVIKGSDDYNQLTMFGENKHYNSGDVTPLVYYVI